MSINVPAKNMREMQANLERLERREWWRWAIALGIMLLLTLGLLSLSLPGTLKDSLSQSQLDLTVKCLLAMVLVFVVFAIYQQRQIARSRRQLAGQIGMLATLEALKPPSPEDQKGRRERRRGTRYPFEQRLKVTVKERGEDDVIFGHVIDISELGLGAILTEPLERGGQVLLEFRSGGESGSVLRVSAVIRYGRGFRHGFEFSSLTPDDAETLKRTCRIAGQGPSNTTVPLNDSSPSKK